MNEKKFDKNKGVHNMNLQELQRKNPDKKIYSVNDREFRLYGQCIENHQLDETLEMALQEVHFPIKDSEYRASESVLSSIQS